MLEKLKEGHHARFVAFDSVFCKCRPLSAEAFRLDHVNAAYSSLWLRNKIILFGGWAFSFTSFLLKIDVHGTMDTMVTMVKGTMAP